MSLRYALRQLGLGAASILAMAGTGPGVAATEAPLTPASVPRLIAADGSGVARAGVLDGRLRGARGPVDVWVKLDQPSLARTRATLAHSLGAARVRGAFTRLAEQPAVASAMAAQRTLIRAQQSGAAGRLAGLGARELGRVSIAHNAIAVRIDASMLRHLAAMPGVASVRPVMTYQFALSETVPYVGGTALQALGVDGTGVRVAVLDSGIDYTHRNLGGPGTIAAYTACYAQRDAAPAGACAALFGPAAPKVIGGFDFVGDAWPNGARTEDPNPIDAQGHGTHVADIIAGRSADGSHKGMAPGAKLLAIKVCSSVASACNGVALLKAVDFALDPNGDGSIADAVDVMNLSLGSDYGQAEDDLTEALTNAVAAGVVVVASAGNGADRPYKVGSPSTAAGVISVAQTEVPSAQAIPLVINAPAAIAGSYGNTATLDWAPIVGTTTGNVVYVGRGCAADAQLADPAGKIALIDRGSCNISEKVDKAARAGAVGTLIALVAAGDAISFSLGNGSQFVPSLVIQQSLRNSIRAQLNAGATVNATLSPSNAIALVGGMAGSSSRGPSISTQGIKPEIGAPGASVSAEVGTGAGQTAFGGTSGASPMVAGAAALLAQAFPARTPLQIKAMLMNSAETNILTSRAIYPGQLAPVTRIGAGELRVNRAYALTGIVYDAQALSSTLGFGALEANQQRTVTRTLTVENFSGSPKSYSLASAFRYASDQASNAVSLQFPGTVNVPANSSTSFDVTVKVNPALLSAWPLNGGSSGGNGQLLNGPEFDGYLTLSAGGETLSVPWHVLPRKAADAYAAYSASRGASQFTVANSGAESAAFDVFSLLASSPQLPGPLPAPGSNEAVVDLRSAGARYLTQVQCGVAGGCLQFAISTYGRRASALYPGGFEVDVDTNGDGTADYYVFTDESGGFGASGQSLVFIQAAGAASSTAFFYTGIDFNSGNAILTVPLSALGSPSTSTPLGLDFFVYDNYFTGAFTDQALGLKFTPATPRFSAASSSGSVAPATTARVTFTKNNAVTAAQSSELGLLLMYGRNSGNESQEIRP